MNSNLLYVPFRSTKDVALGEELRSIIRKEYFQSPNIFENDLTQLTKIRYKISHLKDEQVDKSLEIIVKHYYIQLVNLTKKFANEIIEFLWFGTLGYKPSGPYKLRSLKFEQYNIIYQLGCLYSQLALKESRFTDDGLKKACNYFQLSAGCFEFLISCIEQDEFMKKYNSNNDLSIDTLMHLKYLMLSQAQECVWQKAVNSEMKNSVISKLSIETSKLYEFAIEYGNKSDFIKLEFVNHCYVKHYHFLSASHYRQSLICLDKAQYGEQVGHLKKALISSEKGFKYRSYVRSYVLEDLQGLNNVIKESLKVAERDNDLIYLKPVPDLASLIITSNAYMVNSMLLDEFTNPLNSDRLFLKELIPYLIVQISLAYRDRQDGFILSRILEPLQALNKMMNYFLTERQLPASIDSIQKPENLPESIIHHSQDIITYGGTKLIEDLYDNILQLSSECRDIYEGCQQRLIVEQEEDEVFRDRYPNWNRPKSQELSKDLWFKINSMDEYLVQADKADDIILLNYHEIKDYLDLYCGGYESLIKFIPNSTYMNLDENLSIVVNDIREALNETYEMELQRKEFLKNLENKSKDNNILPKVIGAYKSNPDGYIHDLSESSFEPLFQGHMKMFNEDLEFVELLKNKQMVLENKIDDLNQRFIELYSEEYENGEDGEDGEDDEEDESRIDESKSPKKPNSDRKNSLQILEDIYSQYLQLITNLNEARKFYTDFMKRGNSVLAECDNFVNKRREEARDLEVRLNSGGMDPSVPNSSVSNSAAIMPERYSASDSSSPSPPPLPKVVTPIPVVPHGSPNRSNNSTPVTKDLNILQEQFNRTSIQKGTSLKGLSTKGP